MKSPLLRLVNTLPVPAHFPRPRALQSEENRNAAKRDDNQECSRNAEIKDETDVEAAPINYSQPSKAKSPNTPNDRVSDSDSTRLLESQVGDGVNNSQVVHPSGQHLKQTLSEGGERPDAVPYHHHLRKFDIATTEEECEPQGFIQLHDDGVIGDDVTVTCLRGGSFALFPPLLVTQVEDQEGEREEEGVDDRESRDDKDAHSGTEALAEKKIEGGVGGEVRRNKGDVGKGRGVD